MGFSLVLVSVNKVALEIVKSVKEEMVFCSKSSLYNRDFHVFSYSFLK
jgi:hypothetical protein